MGRLIVVNSDGDPDKDRNMVQHLLGMCLVGLCVRQCVLVSCFSFTFSFSFSLVD